MGILIKSLGLMCDTGIKSLYDKTLHFRWISNYFRISFTVYNLVIL
jgi:hypothetical protein